MPVSASHFDCQKLAGLSLARLINNHVRIYGSSVAKGFWAFQRRFCLFCRNTMQTKNIVLTKGHVAHVDLILPVVRKLSQLQGACELQNANHVRIYVSLMWNILIRSGHDFAHVPTSELSCHVLSSDLLSLLETKLRQLYFDNIWIVSS